MSFFSKGGLENVYILASFTSGHLVYVASIRLNCLASWQVPIISVSGLFFTLQTRHSCFAKKFFSYHLQKLLAKKCLMIFIGYLVRVFKSSDALTLIAIQ
jgi:hypothetical protein